MKNIIMRRLGSERANLMMRKIIMNEYGFAMKKAVMDNAILLLRKIGIGKIGLSMKTHTSRKVAVACTLLLSVGLVTGCSQVTNTLLGSNGLEGIGSKYTITLIAKAEEGIFWSNVHAGASAASTEYNLNLVFKGPENEEDYMTQNQMILQAVEDGTDAIVFSAIDFLANATAIDQAAAAGVKIVVIDSDVNSDKVRSRIGTDNYGAGRVAGEAVLSSDKPQLNIGIVNFNVITENGQSRERGFRSVVAEDPRARIIDTINVISTVEYAKEGTIEMLERNPEINVIATFNEWTSLGVGFAMREIGEERDITVVAFDSNVYSVDMLENGEINALVIQSPYAIGYLGVEVAYRLLQGSGVEEVIYTPVMLATRENMYDEEYKRLIFVFDK